MERFFLSHSLSLSVNLFTLSDPTYLRSGRQQELVRVPGIPLGEGTQDSILVGVYIYTSLFVCV